MYTALNEDNSRNLVSTSELVYGDGVQVHVVPAV